MRKELKALGPASPNTFFDQIILPSNKNFSEKSSGFKIVLTIVLLSLSNLEYV